MNNAVVRALKVSECHESKTNPRGTDFEDKAFADLVASVKEKGVLMPVLARPSDKGFEIVAGNRRLRAAKKAGLEEITARIVEMTDDEAREAQIVENLQRADIHPLDEGEAYRQLIEDAGRTIADVAVKVGKSDTYVRQRLFLTNLSENARKAYRSGKVKDSVAVLIARLSPKNQDQVLKECSYDLDDPSEIKDYIANEFTEPLKNQPWLKDKKAMIAVGPCNECPPPRTALFGDIKEGQCTDLRCYTRKLKAYFEWRVKENPELVLVSTLYGKAERANVISQSQYELVKEKACDYVTEAIVVEGEDIGSSLLVCFDKECTKHRRNDSEYAPSDKERAKRKKERERDEARRTKFDDGVTAALLKVKWPLSEKHLNALLELSLTTRGTSYIMPIVKRHDLKPDKKKGKYGIERDYTAPLRRLAEEGGRDAKLRLIFELLLPTYWSHGDDREMLKKVAHL